MGNVLRKNSTRPAPNSLTSSTSSGTMSEFLPANADDFGSGGEAVYNESRTSGQEEPEKTAMDVAGEVAEDDSIDTKSALSDHILCLIGNENARPG